MSIRKNSLWNLIGLAAPSVVGLFTIPVLLHGLGNELFGLLTLIWVLVGYFSLFDLGLGRAYTQFAASSDLSELVNKKIIRTGFVFSLSLGLFGGMVVFLMRDVVVSEIFNVSKLHFNEAKNSLAIVALAIPLTVVTSVFRGMLEGFEDFKSVNILRLFFGILNFIVPMIVVLIIPSLEYVVTSLIILRAVVTYLHYKLLLNHINLIDIYKIKSNFSDGMRLVKFGSWISVTNVIGPIMVNADRFILSHLVGASLVVFYTIPADMLMRVLVLPEAISSVLFAKFSKIIKTDKTYSLSLCKKSFLIYIILMIFICLPVLLFGTEIIDFWLGSSYGETSGTVLKILALGLFFNAITNVPYVYIQASGNSKITAKFHIIELIIYVPLLVYLVKLYGVYGAAWSWVFRVILDFIFVTSYFVKNIK